MVATLTSTPLFKSAIENFQLPIYNAFDFGYEQHNASIATPPSYITSSLHATRDDGLRNLRASRSPRLTQCGGG
ncbi:hypothetical protein HUU05_18925 [candidate division KSB1 bacterium]|nr:hypothetical protein [candidate division KSB1 bacterium]